MGFFDRFLNAIKLNDDLDDDEDFLDEDEEAYDEEDSEEFERPREKRRFFSKFRSDDDDDMDDYDDDDEEVSARASRTSRRASARSASSRTTASSRRSTTARSSEPDTSASRRTSLRNTDTPARTSAARTSARTSRTAGASAAERSSARTRDTESRTSRRQREKVTPIRNRKSMAQTAGNGMEVSVIRPSSMEDSREIADTLMNSCTVILNLEGLDFDIAQRVIDFACGVCYSLHGNLQKVAEFIFILTPPDVDISGDFQSILGGFIDLPSLRMGY